MICPEALEALQDRLDGVAPKDAAGLDAHLAGCAECRQVAQEFGELDAGLGELYGSALPFDENVLRAAVRQAVTAVPPRRRPWTWGAAAAAVLLAICAGWYATRTAEQSSAVAPAPSTGRPADAALHRPGDRPEILEVAGARVVAGARTNLDLTGERRIRQGEGEAFFIVEKNPNGFVVETAFGSVAVTGTQFLVEVEESGSRIMLIEGSVRLQGAKGELVLKPGEAGHLAAGVEPVRVAWPDAVDAMLWMPWEALDETRAAERLVLLKTRMASADLAAQRAARGVLCAGFPAQVTKVLGWLEDPEPRLRLETVLALRSAPVGHLEVCTALRKALGSEVQAAMRQQIALTFGVIGRREDLPVLEELLRTDGNVDVRAAAAEALKKIEARAEKTPAVKTNDEPEF